MDDGLVKSYATVRSTDRDVYAEPRCTAAAAVARPSLRCFGGVALGRTSLFSAVLALQAATASMADGCPRAACERPIRHTGDPLWRGPTGRAEGSRSG